MYIINTHEDFPVVGFLHTKGWLQVLVHETDCNVAGNKVLLPISFSLNYLHGNGNQKDVLSLNLSYNWDNRWNILWIYCILENIRPSVGFFSLSCQQANTERITMFKLCFFKHSFFWGNSRWGETVHSVVGQKIQVAKRTLYRNWQKYRLNTKSALASFLDIN